MKRIQEYFKRFEGLVKNSVSYILSSLIVIVVEIVIIGLAQVILDYGNMKIYIVCFGLGLIHSKAVKLLMNLGRK